MNTISSQKNFPLILISFILFSGLKPTQASACTYYLDLNSYYDRGISILHEAKIAEDLQIKNAIEAKLASLYITPGSYYDADISIYATSAKVDTFSQDTGKHYQFNKVHFSVYRGSKEVDSFSDRRRSRAVTDRSKLNLVNEGLNTLRDLSQWCPKKKSD